MPPKRHASLGRFNPKAKRMRARYRENNCTAPAAKELNVHTAPVAQQVNVHSLQPQQPSNKMDIQLQHSLAFQTSRLL